MEDAERVNERRASRREQVHAALATVAGAGVALGAGGSVGDLAGTLTGLFVGLGLQADALAFERSKLCAAVTLETAAEQLNLNVDEISQEITASNQRLQFTAAVLHASATTITAEEKVEALGRVLAHGLQHEDQFDPAVALAAALRDMEKPHVAVLRDFADPYWSTGRPLIKPSPSMAPTYPHAWADQRRLEAAGGGALTLPGVIATLTAHGLTAQELMPTDYRNGTQAAYRITRLGLLCLHMLAPEQYGYDHVPLRAESVAPTDLGVND